MDIICNLWISCPIIDDVIRPFKPKLTTSSLLCIFFYYCLGVHVIVVRVVKFGSIGTRSSLMEE